MFEEIFVDLTERIGEHSKLKKSIIETPLEKSFDIIIDQINLDVVKILKYNRI